MRGRGAGVVDVSRFVPSNTHERTREKTWSARRSERSENSASCIFLSSDVLVRARESDRTRPPSYTRSVEGGARARELTVVDTPTPAMPRKDVFFRDRLAGDADELCGDGERSGEGERASEGSALILLQVRRKGRRLSIISGRSGVRLSQSEMPENQKEAQKRKSATYLVLVASRRFVLVLRFPLSLFVPSTCASLDLFLL